MWIGQEGILVAGKYSDALLAQGVGRWEPKYEGKSHLKG
jgi:hypothetical protein